MYAMLSEFILENKTFALQEKAQTWQQAVKKSVDLLVACGCAEACYYDAILNSVKEYGPYFVIAPGIAMPHARPEQGALKIGFSLVSLAQPLNFGNATNDPVDLILCITAPDKEALNEKVIVEVMDLFDNENALKHLRSAQNGHELKDALNGEK